MFKKFWNKKNNQLVAPKEDSRNKQSNQLLEDNSSIEQTLSNLEIPSGRNASELLTKLLSTECLALCESVFCEYPQHALVNARSRALLYILTRFLKPNHVLEIGTYWAGSSEIITRALRHNGQGVLVTIDPFGKERVPAILENWTSSLQQYIKYLPLSSMECFIKLEPNTIFDLIFVDGDHSYEYALYDLQMAARCLAPNGIVIMDNAEQTGVYWAVKTFLSISPGWRELGTSVAEHDIRNPYATMRPSVPESSFLILQKPDRIFLNQHPRSFETRCAAESGLIGFELSFTGEQNAGNINALIFFRSFMHGGLPGSEQESTIERIPVASGATVHRLLFQKPFVTKLVPEASFRSYEIILTYDGSGSDTLLELTCPPIPIKMS